MFTSKDKKRFSASKQKFLEVLKDRTEGVGELVAIESLKWCNVKLPYNSAAGLKRAGMAGMLRELRIELAGKHHCGIDDCRNIAKVCVELINRYGEGALYETK